MTVKIGEKLVLSDDPHSFDYRGIHTEAQLCGDKVICFNNSTTHPIFGDVRNEVVIFEDELDMVIEFLQSIKKQ